MARQKREYLIDRILPHTEVHLVGGSSGAGKTRWLFQTLIDDWQRGRPVLGYASHPRPWAYLVGDRTIDDACATLEDLHYNPDDVRMYSAMENGILDLGRALDKVMEFDPKPEVVVVEGLASLTPDKCDLNKYKDVARFLGSITRLCKLLKLTIIGVVHSPKMKEDAQYLNARQRLMGSVAWAAYSGTVILVEEMTAGSQEASLLRRLTVLPRNAPEMYLNLQFTGEGRLIEVDAALNDVLFDTFLRKFKAGDTFKTADAIEALEPMMSRATINRLLDAASLGGFIEKVERGLFRVKHKV